MLPTLLAAILTLSPPPLLPAEPSPSPPGRVLTLPWLHLGIRPAVYVSPRSEALGVTVQVSADVL